MQKKFTDQPRCLAHELDEVGRVPGFSTEHLPLNVLNDRLELAQEGVARMRFSSRNYLNAAAGDSASTFWLPAKLKSWRRNRADSSVEEFFRRTRWLPRHRSSCPAVTFRTGSARPYGHVALNFLKMELRVAWVWAVNPAGDFA